MKRVCSAVVATVLGVTLMACGSGEPPELPPEDTMILPSFDGTNPNAQTQGSTLNVGTAAASVGLVTFVVQLATIAPRGFLAGVLTAQAEKDGDAWVWSRDFPLPGRPRSSRMRLRLCRKTS